MTSKETAQYHLQNTLKHYMNAYTNSKEEFYEDVNMLLKRVVDSYYNDLKSKKNDAILGS